MLVFYTLSFLTLRSNRRLPFWLRNVSVETHGRLAADPAQRSHRSGRYPQTRRIRDRLRVDKCGHARSEESPYSSPKLCAIEEIRQLKSRYFEATATTTRSMSAWAGRGSSPRSLRLGFALSGLRKAPAGRHAQPSELFNVALFVASDEAGFVHGAVYMAGGGWTTH